MRGKRGKICIVDHDLASRGYLRECLEKQGHYVVTLDNGLQIKPYLSEGTFDVFILNIETPGVREKDLLLDIRKAHRARILLIVSERGDAFLRELLFLPSCWRRRYGRMLSESLLKRFDMWVSKDDRCPQLGP